MCCRSAERREESCERYRPMTRPRTLPTYCGGQQVSYEITIRVQRHTKTKMTPRRTEKLGRNAGSSSSQKMP
jgi:hypothetical protein